MKARAGFVGFGEVNTPRDIIENKCGKAVKLLQGCGIEPQITAPVSDDPGGVDVARAVDELSTQRFDSLVLCIAGWIPSHAVISIADRFRHLPIVLWGLAGWMENGRLITTADQAGTSALRKPMRDMGFRFKYVYDTIDGGSRVNEVADYVTAAAAAARLRGARIGMMGYRDMNLYGTLYDGPSLRSTIGIEVEQFEMLEIAQRVSRVSASDIDQTIASIRTHWRFSAPASDEILSRGAGYYLAIREKIRERHYRAVSLKDVDGMKKLAGLPPAMIFMLLADNEGICTIPENDVLGNVTQLMVNFCTGQIGAYLEFYEFMTDRALLGVPDYVPREIVDGPVIVTPAAFGGLSGGVLNVSKVKSGRATLVRLAHEGGRYSLHVVPGNALAPRAWEEAGWTPPAPQLPGIEFVPDMPLDRFAQNVLSQHYIIVFGDNIATLTDLCAILGIEVI